MKKQLIRAAATTVLGLSLTTGMAAAQTGTINQTGASSANHIEHTVRNTQTVHNATEASVSNNSTQRAYSGPVTSNENTTGGDAASGFVSNDNAARTSAHVSSSSSSTPMLTSTSDGGGSASISNTGFNSENKVKSEVTNTSDVKNNTKLNVSNNNSQESSSGSVNSSRNTTAGNATSGDVNNTSNTATELSVSN